MTQPERTDETIRFAEKILELLVVAHKRCNGYKKDFLAASDHVQQWADRFRHESRSSSDLGALSEITGWERDAGKTCSAARALYLRLPADAKLWHAGRTFEQPDFARLRYALCS
jgi:hypothetical protein